MYIILNACYQRDGNGFLVSSKELDVASSGQTIEEANSNFRDALVTYLNTIEELGIREEVFAKRRVKIYTSIPSSIRHSTPVSAESPICYGNVVQHIPAYC